MATISKDINKELNIAIYTVHGVAGYDRHTRRDRQILTAARLQGTSSGISLKKAPM